LKVTFSKTSQSTTSHKVYTIQVEFEVLRATNLRYPKLPIWGTQSYQFEVPKATNWRYPKLPIWGTQSYQDDNLPKCGTV